MGSRGQGKKGGKRGTKGKKGGKPSNKWGDEHTVQDDDRHVKKRPRITQVSTHLEDLGLTIVFRARSSKLTELL